MNQGPTETTVLVLGDGVTAIGLVENLIEMGLPVIFATPGVEAIKQPPVGLEILNGFRLDGLHGQVGDFLASLSDGAEVAERRVGALAIAYENQSRPFYSLSDFSPNEGILTLSEAEAIVLGEGQIPPGIQNVILLDDPKGTSKTVSSERLFRVVLEFQRKRGINCHLISSQIKVASRNLELLYGQVRDSGCLISKTDEEVHIQTDSDSLSVRFSDPILDEELALFSDLIVIGEDYAPSHELCRLAGILRLETGPNGFLQADNVLRSTCLTNRRGILVVGPSAGPVSRWDREQSLKAASVEIHGLYKWIAHADHPETIVYNRDTCAYCLTCFRACPHGAIHFTNRPHFFNLACQMCGVCTSACPGEALQLIDNGDDFIKRQMNGIRSAGGSEGKKSILAFACRKSASIVLKNWNDNDPSLLSLKWIEVPCAGAVRIRYLLNALSAGDAFDGVLVLACHEDNCRSGAGSALAKRLVAGTKEILERIGCEGRVVEYISTAPNDSTELVRKINEFRDSLR